eukprot:TRINITY_DN8_c0_g1_i10.p1 TRINITY_DN8_c0_g1~~TRINITY_DN8_c0_g1_i10.p1  ORF type:complete len:1022 (+),score=256.36 TRINITY_DN8_c0_g1_i10:116-3181(+)
MSFDGHNTSHGSVLTLPGRQLPRYRMDERQLEEMDARSVFVGNVEFASTSEQLMAHFQGCGKINRTTIMRDKFNDRPLGFAFIEFESKDGTAKALQQSGSIFNGRRIQVVPKRTNPNDLNRTRRISRSEQIAHQNQLLLELNEYLDSMETSVSNLKEDLQDGAILLALLNQANIEEASSFHKRKGGKDMSPSQVRQNHTSLCKILNKYGNIYGFQSDFHEKDVLTHHTVEAVQIVLCILDQCQSLIPSPSNPIPGATYANPGRWEGVKDNRIIRIFLSSTFRDMQRERDAFFQYGEPRLREWAKKKGLVLDFIDLRWGLTTEVSSNGEVTIRCYESIEQCPYFICALGSRYGWTPDHSKPNEWHADTDKRYPFLKEYGDLSVTHYEIKYGALKKNPIARRAFFYERDEAHVLANTPDLTENERTLYQAVNEKDRMNQNAMKQEIRQQFDVKMYQSAKKLTELIVNDMIAVFKVDFGDMKPVSEDEDQAHEQLMRHRLSGFQGRTEMLENLTKKVKYQLENNAAKISVIGAESGVGKSSVMAALARKLQMDASFHVIYHFVGCSNLSQYVESMNQRVYQLLFDRQVFVDPPDSEQGKEIIKKDLDEILKHASVKSSFPIVLLVDAVNQLVDSQDYPHVHQLNWLPKSLPKNVALVVSTIDTHASCQAARKAGLEITPLSRLPSNEVIEAAESFMKKYDKTLSEVQKKFILQDIKDTGHPLYLRIILDEMRVFGVFETVDKELQDLLETDGVLELYDLVMRRWEKQYNTIRFIPQSPITFEIVKNVISVLRVSRIGLDDNELDDYIAYLLGRKLAGEEISIWKSFFFKLIDSLFVRNGRYTFFHQLLEQAVQKRYLSNPDVEVNIKKMYGDWLHNKYKSMDADAAVIAEICHSLCFGKEYAKLERFLADGKVVTLMLDIRYKYEFFRCWRILNKNGFDHKKTYGEMAKTFTDAGTKLVGYFQDVRESGFLIPILKARISERASEDEKAADYGWLGWVLDDFGQLVLILITNLFLSLFFECLLY